MLPGRQGSLPLREKTLNQIDYAKETWPVFPTEKESIFGKQEETLPVHFPAPSGVVLAKTATSSSAGASRLLSPQLWGSSRCCAGVRTESLCRGRRRQSTAARGSGNRRGNPGGTCRG